MGAGARMLIPLRAARRANAPRQSRCVRHWNSTCDATRRCPRGRAQSQGPVCADRLKPPYCTGNPAAPVEDSVGPCGTTSGAPRRCAAVTHGLRSSSHAERPRQDGFAVSQGFGTRASPKPYRRRVMVLRSLSYFRNVCRRALRAALPWVSPAPALWSPGTAVVAWHRDIH